MSHVRRRPSHQQGAITRKRHRKRMLFGIFIIITIVLSITLSIILLVMSMY